MTFDEPIRLLGWDDLRARGIKNSKPTIYRKIKAGEFPAQSTGKSPAWPEHEIDAHILSLIARRDAAQSPPLTPSQQRRPRECGKEKWEEPGVGRAEFQYLYGSDCKLDQ